MSSSLIKLKNLGIPLLAVLILPLILSSGSLATEILIFALAAAACNLLLGYAGLMSFGQGIFFGVGSYALGLILIKTEIPIIFALLLTIIIGGAVAFAVSWVAIRQKGIYFVMLTLALAQMFYFFAFSMTDITGGDNGLIGIPMPPVKLFDFVIFKNGDLWEYYIFVATIFIIIFWGMQRIVESIFGRTMLAMKNNPDRLSALGYDINKFKLLAFILSGGITALAGGLYAMMIGIASLESIDLDRSEIILLITIIGGTNRLSASILGAVFYVMLSNWLSHIWPRWLMIFGFLLMGISLYMQGGLWSACQLIIKNITVKFKKFRGASL